MFSARATQFTVLQVTAGPKWLAALEVVFQPTGLRDLEGVLSLAVSQRGQPERRSMRGERGSLGTLSCYSVEVGRNGQGECVIAPVREWSVTALERR